ncbi:hypothetical protein [Dactylosporangium sp. NPDC051541]|uniref:hypothetical protein n=1 Tax=Dactylosporangium sp. NPDC051541 TaxID=3363977 RepID=UPI0037954389
MSGSPKYNSVDLAAARRAQAEAERAERARKREQQRQKRLAAAVQRTRATTTRRCAALASRYAALTGPATAAGLGAEAAAQAATVQQVAAEIAAAPNHPALAAANRRLDLLERQIEALSDAVSLRQEAAASARLAQLTTRLEAIPRAERLRLDTAGGQAAEAALGTAAESTQPAAEARSAETVERAARQVAEHLERVRAAKAERAAAIREAEFQIDELASRLDALEADGRDLHIEVEGARFAHDYLGRMRGLAADGRLDELAIMLGQVTAALGRTEQSFDDRVERIVERRRILASIVAGLPEMGFGVVAGSLSERPDGSVSVRAETTRGDALDVLVHDGEGSPHEVLYSSSDLAAEEAAGGITGSTCGSLLDLVGALNERAGQDGYVTGTVSWDDGDPGPGPRHTGATRPAAAPQTRKGLG